MPIQQRAQRREVDGVFMHKLGYANEVLRAADPQCVCYDMLWTENPASDGALGPVDLDIDVSGLRERLYIKLACYRQELDRPALDYNSFFVMLLVTLLF